MKRLPAFSVILVFVVLSVAGAAMLPLLSLQYTPTEKKSSLTVTASWSGASAKLIESEVTQVLEGLASYGMPEAKTFHGLAYLMDDKPWYDYGKGLAIMKEAADDDDPRSAFSKHQLGRVYLEGRKGGPSDPVSGKWWIEQAAGLGFRPAIEEKESRWGI